MATFLRPLGIVLRNYLSTYNIRPKSYTDRLIRTQQFLCPDHLKKEIHSLCIKSGKVVTVEDLTRPACGYIHFSRSMAQNGVDANKLKASTEMDQFNDVFPELVDDLTKKEIKNLEIADAFIRFKKVLLYNVTYGRKLRGVSVVTTYKYLVPGASEADLKIARVLGWCIELLNACMLIADDIMDNTLTRRGRTCWYRKENVGLTAINDSFFLESCFYSLLRKYIRNKPYYLTILELFTQAGISDEETHTKAQTILLQLGHVFQVQNDYRDCYGSPEVAGKVGSDIEENKCTWLIMKALEIASEEQKEELKLNYGRWDKEAVEKVKAIYRDLKLEDVYKQYEESCYQEIISLINSADTALPKEIFLHFANKIYKEMIYFSNVDG